MEGAKRCESCTLSSRRKYARLREEMLDNYGRQCAQCGFADPDCLQLDHVNDDGADARRSANRFGGVLYYNVLRRAGWPRAGYQVLCANCNTKKEMLRRRGEGS